MNQRDYPVADVEWKKLISLPCHPGMSDEDIDYVIYWVSQYFSDKLLELQMEQQLPMQLFFRKNTKNEPWWKFW